MTERYEPQNFLEAFDDFVARENISTDRKIAIYDWMMARPDHPYEGARREVVEDMTNYWFARVPHTQANGRVVTCSFWIHERAKVVQCDNFAILSLPV